jgi:hypothetical protein
MEVPVRTLLRENRLGILFLVGVIFYAQTFDFGSLL